MGCLLFVTLVRLLSTHLQRNSIRRCDDTTHFFHESLHSARGSASGETGASTDDTSRVELSNFQILRVQ